MTILVVMFPVRSPYKVSVPAITELSSTDEKVIAQLVRKAIGD
jgi:hypothetical protein